MGEIFLVKLMVFLKIIFTESVHWPDSVSKLQCPLLRCLCILLETLPPGFWVVANKSTVHNGGVSRGRFCWCGWWALTLVTGDKRHMKNYKWSLTPATWFFLFFFFSVCFGPFKYWCNYPHTSRDSMSPVCRIFPPIVQIQRDLV